MRGLHQDDLIQKILDAEYPSVSEALLSYRLTQLTLFSLSLAIAIWLIQTQNIPPTVLFVLLAGLFFYSIVVVGYLLDKEVADKRQKREQCLPEILLALNMYYKSGYSIASSFKALSEDLEFIFPSFARRLFRAHLVLNTESNNDIAWKKISEIMGIPGFYLIGERMQVREQQGYKMSEVLLYSAEQLSRDLALKENLRIEKLPLKITLISICFFLTTLIILMGAMVYFKLLEVIQAASQFV